MSEDAEHLLVINSDFDLQFAQGTIQSLDMARIREIARRPCSGDSDCSSGELCDTEPSEENGTAPSFFCVDAADPRPCGPIGEKSPPQLSVAPGRCSAIDLGKPFDGGAPLLVDVAETSAFATQGILLRRPCLQDGALVDCEVGTPSGDRIQQSSGESTPERLFVPIRGDTTIHYLDLADDGTFRCGRGVELGGEVASYESGSGGKALRCSSAYRIDEGTTYALSSEGTVQTTSEPPEPSEEDDEEPEEPTDAFRLPPEPLDLDASDDGRVIVVSHQLDGRASALVNSWVQTPQLVHILEGLQENPVGVGFLSHTTPRGVADFLLTYRSDARVELLRFTDDGLLDALHPSGPTDEQLERGTTVYRPALAALASETITLNSVGSDSRGIAVDSSRRDAAVAGCGGEETCLTEAGTVALDVFIANRSPNSLLVGRTGGTDLGEKVSALPEFYQNIPLTAGPSRVVIGHVTSPEGEKLLRVFVLCFDSALIYIYDPERGRIESEIRTGRGPYAMAFDSESSLAFVAHFTDSHIGVVSLDQAYPMTFGATVATLGEPKPPRASK